MRACVSECTLEWVNDEGARRLGGFVERLRIIEVCSGTGVAQHTPVAPRRRERRHIDGKQPTEDGLILPD